MGNIDPQFKRNFSGGMATNVNPNLVPENTVALALNLDADEELGSLVSRPGTDIVGSQLQDGKVILGIGNYTTPSGTSELYAVVNNSGDTNSVIKDVSDGSDDVTGLTASKKMRFLMYLGELLAINGTDAERAYNGTSWITTGGAFDLANWPAVTNVVAEFLDRVYTAGDSSNPDRLYYSSVPSSGAISWTSGNGSVDIEPEDGGGGIIALGKVPGYLLIFKKRSLHRFNFVSAFPESLIAVGAPSQESVVSAGGLCGFFSASSRDARGFYVTNGSEVIPISHDKPNGLQIKKWIDAIPQASEQNIAGWGNKRYFAWSIGDVTVDGVSYKNVILKWNRILDQWTVRTYPSEFRVFETYLTGGSFVTVGGDDDGNVIEINKKDTYTDYSSTPINWEIRTHKDRLGFNQKKEIQERVIWYTEGAKGAEARIWADGEQKNQGKIDKDISEVNIKELRGSIFEFGLAGTVKGSRAYIRELEIPNIEVNLNYDD